ncbi:MAG: hypothetical protein OES13_00215 [Acidimicrobiia bacterium]|nr:hypothetical protein [Acidimicrobiia bacterium]
MGKNKPQTVELTDDAIERAAAEGTIDCNADPRITSTYRKDSGRTVTVSLTTDTALTMRASQVARLIVLSQREQQGNA